jgi:hypothetical protein
VRVRSTSNFLSVVKQQQGEIAMKRLAGAWLALILAFGLSVEALAVDTRIDVRVLSKGAKFIGTGVAGAEITIRDAETDELLARGKTVGDSGNDHRIMVESWPRHHPLSTETSAVFRATLELEEPRQVIVTARGPLSQPQSTAVATVTQWVVPGKHITGGDGLTLELPGFSVDILHPPARQRVPAGQQRLELRANVMMMCGCPIEPGGLWDADAFEVVALIHQRDRRVAEIALSYAGEIGQFAGSFPIPGPGPYDITVYAFDPRNGNTGVDRTTIVVAAAAAPVGGE